MEKEIDTTRLHSLLAAGKWKEADEETANVIFEVANSNKEEWLRDEDMDNIPCEDLRTINQLWVDYSNGHFGFSVQKEIFQRIGVTREYNKEMWRRFGDTVGWYVNNKWIGMHCTFDLTAPQGHLPVMGVWVKSYDDWPSDHWYGCRLLTLYLLAHKTSCKICVSCFGIKMAVASAFTQAKTSTNNFPKNSRKTAKVNSLVWMESWD
jgi:GUN4-like protein